MPRRLLVEAVDGRRRKMPPVYLASWFMRQTPASVKDSRSVSSSCTGRRINVKLYFDSTMILVCEREMEAELGEWSKRNGTKQN
jgi:hypothetical protein